MENKIPLPTDNVYKFYALFGLLVFIFSVGGMLYSTKSTNEILFSLIIEGEQLNQLPSVSHLEQVKKQVLERKIQLAISDKKTVQYGLLALIALAAIAIWYGFSKWHTEIQPRQDEMASVQLAIAKCQLRKIREEWITLDAKEEENG